MKRSRNVLNHTWLSDFSVRGIGMNFDFCDKSLLLKHAANVLQSATDLSAPWRNLLMVHNGCQDTNSIHIILVRYDINPRKG